MITSYTPGRFIHNSLVIAQILLAVNLVGEDEVYWRENKSKI